MKASPRKQYIIFLLVYLGLYEIFDSYLTIGYTMQVSLVLDYFQTTLSSYYTAVAFGSMGMFFVVITLVLADLIGRKLLIIIVFFGMGLSMYLLSLTQTIEQYGYALFAMFLFFSSDLWVLLIAEEAPPEKRARYSYIISAIGVLGIFLIPIFKVFLTQTGDPASWKRMTWFGWLAMPLSLLGLCIREPATTRDRKLLFSPDKIKTQMKALFTEGQWRMTLVFMGIGLLIGLNAVSFQSIENYLMRTLSVDLPDPEVRKNTIALILTIANVGSLSVYAFTGLLADRYGRKPILLLYSILFGISVFCLVISAETGIMILLFASVFTAQMGYWGLFSLIKLYNAECFPARVRGTAAGLRTLTYAIGMSLGSLLAGLLLSWFPDYVVYLLYAGCYTVGVSLFSKILPETRGLDIRSERPFVLVQEPA